MAASRTPQRYTTSRLANLTAFEIRRAFDRFQHKFRAITRRAAARFAQRDWRGMQADCAERLEVYNGTVDQLVARIEQLLGERIRSRLVWVSSKAVYSGLITDRDDWEVAETFFNSVTRRIFTTVGVDQEIEFVHPDYESPPTPARKPVFRTYESSADTQRLVQSILRDYGLPWSPEQLQREALAIAEHLQRRLASRGDLPSTLRVEMLMPPFFRDEFAYLIGRIVGQEEDELIPLVLCLQHAPEGIRADAVLLEENDVSLLFSFARSYFQVDVVRPYELVRFIKSIIPRKPTAEIYISVGYTKHGKTELYRHALRHLASSHDKYQLAPGQRGMVMTVFTMPSYPVVFKIIKDHFDYPKECTRQSVIDQYRLVFNHDRAGRLIDAQEYQYLELDRRRFDDQLLAELLEVAANTVRVVDDRVVIKHCYAERRVTPLNVYLQEAEPAAAAEAVIDYGRTIKDLAITNIFPGDLLLKNFGVTRRQRVVFYDYDEVCLLTQCTVRALPECADYDDQMADEPWFGVGKYDIFPEEFRYFLGLSPPLREVFLQHHGDLLTLDFWRDIQQRLQAGEILHVAPYADDKRLTRRANGTCLPRQQPQQRDHMKI